MPEKFAEPFESSDEPCRALDLRDVDWIGIRMLASAVIERGMLDASRAPRAALDEVRRGGWSFWLMILDVHPATVLRRLEEIAREVPADRPLPACERVSFTRRDPAPTTKEQAIASWTRAQWEDAIVASPTMMELARRAGASWETCRIQLLHNGLLPKHGRYHVLRGELLLDRETAAWAAEWSPCLRCRREGEGYAPAVPCA